VSPGIETARVPTGRRVDARTWEACVPFVLEEYEKRREKQREKERRRRTSRARRRLADEKRWRELQESGEHTWPEMKLNDNHWAVVRGHGVSEEIAHREPAVRRPV
jgi:hypothetical protein